MLYPLILILMGSSICLVTLSFISSYGRRPRLGLELSPHSTRRVNFSKTLQFFEKASWIINKPFSNLGYIKRLQRQAQFLKIPLGALGLFLIKELVMIALGILTFFLISPSYSLIACLVGFFLPDIILSYKIKAKKEAIIKVFPETVDLLDLCISAGLDFLSSIRWVTEKSLPNPFIEQLETISNEIRIGKSRIDALKDMADRLKIPDISSFVRTIIQAERLGTSVEEALKNLSEDTRMARFQRGERYAIKASLKILFPLLFFILPVILIVVAGPVIISFTQGGLGAGLGAASTGLK